MRLSRAEGLFVEQVEGYDLIDMEKLVDITKLKTVLNTSFNLRVSVPTVYNKIKRGEIKSIVIDGVTFCVEEE